MFTNRWRHFRIVLVGKTRLPASQHKRIKARCNTLAFMNSKSLEVSATDRYETKLEYDNDTNKTAGKTTPVSDRIQSSVTFTITLSRRQECSVEPR